MGCRSDGSETLRGWTVNEIPSSRSVLETTTTPGRWRPAATATRRGAGSAVRGSQSLSSAPVRPCHGALGAANQRHPPRSTAAERRRGKPRRAARREPSYPAQLAPASQQERHPVSGAVPHWQWLFAGVSTAATVRDRPPLIAASYGVQQSNAILRHAGRRRGLAGRAECREIRLQRPRRHQETHPLSGAARALPLVKPGPVL